MKRTSKNERKQNARQFNMVMGEQAIIIVNRQESKTNPNINRCQILANTSRFLQDLPKVIGESVEGRMIAFYEFLKVINENKSDNILSILYDREKLNDYLSENFGFYISFDEGFAMILTKATKA